MEGFGILRQKDVLIVNGVNRMLENKLQDGNYQKGKHDKIVKKIERRLEKTGLYNNIIHNTEYTSDFGDGEIDLVAESNDRVFLFEIKCNDHFKSRDKAQEQLLRAECMLSDYKSSLNIYKFYVCGSGNNDYNIRRV